MSSPITSKRAAAARALPAPNPDLARTVLDALPPVAYWDLELRNRMANAAFCEFFGVSPADLSGHHISEVLWPDLLEVALPQFERALAGESRRFDRVTVDLSGATQCAQVTLVPILVDGEVQGSLPMPRTSPSGCGPSASRGMPAPGFVRSSTMRRMGCRCAISTDATSTSTRSSRGRWA